MDRVQIAALVLGIGILVYWFTSLPSGPPPSAPQPTATSGETTPPGVPAQPGASAVSQPQPISPGAVVEPLTQTSKWKLENDAVQLELSDRGGRLTSVRLKNYRDRLGVDAQAVELVTVPSRGSMLMFLGQGPFQGLEQAPHELIRLREREIEIGVERDGVRVRRTLTLDESGYGARLRVRVDNTGAGTLQPTFQLAWYAQDLGPTMPAHFQNYSLVASAEGDLERTMLGAAPGFGCSGGGDQPSEERWEAPVEWLGVDSQYFMAVALPENPGASAYHGPIGRHAGQSVLSHPPVNVPPGSYVEQSYRLYLGPKIREEVTAFDAKLVPAVDVGWGWIKPLVALFEDLLHWTHRNIVANYGVAIILLTILLRLVTFPLTQRSMKSMQRFSTVIAPEMKAMQDKYKDDKARLQQEMMALYKRKGMNPLAAMGGGCLPMLIQMPFLIALYFALQASIELRHAPFMLWIQDLSAPEDFLSIASIPIRPLPLLMGVTMILQQRLTPAPADPQQQQQRQMMMWMSVLFIFLFYSFPSGLVLYWFVSNLLAIAQQLLVKRQAAAEAAKA